MKKQPLRLRFSLAQHSEAVPEDQPTENPKIDSVVSGAAHPEQEPFHFV